MKLYSSFAVNEFIVCLGYKGYMVKEYFANYFLHQAMSLSRHGQESHRISRFAQRARGK